MDKRFIDYLRDELTIPEISDETIGSIIFHYNYVQRYGLREASFSELKGGRITGINYEDDVLILTIVINDETRRFKMYHPQACCESVELIDGLEELKQCLNYTIVDAYVTTNSNDSKDNTHESWTWTYYTIQTDRCSATLRWYGTSNGYYSEGVSFVEIL